MIEFLTSQTGFVVLLWLFALGALGALLLGKYDAPANKWGNCCAIAGSTWGVLFGCATIFAQTGSSFSFGDSAFPLLSFAIRIDAVSAFFIFLISLISLFCSIYALEYVQHYYRRYNIGTLGFFYNIFILGMLLVVTTSNGLFFLIAWECMSVASYVLVVYDHKDHANIKAGYLYLVMTHIATAFIILALILLYSATGTFDFETIKSKAVHIPAAIKNAAFVLGLIGFGTKAGIIPFHIWLPGAHPAAPSHVSALMSGVMIKTGVYMMIRIFLDVLSPIDAWWGLVVLVFGTVSSLLGVLYALTEHDLKKLLAYHSIENVGIILLGLGAALTFSAFGMPALALLGLVAALFHTMNHGIFKSLLFLSAGAVINATKTRNLEKYGGLIRHMPRTALFFLIGSMAISALPPFNGFFSEWLTFQALFQGIMTSGVSIKWIFIVSAGALAFTGGLALCCFVKAFGATFLARPRSPAAQHAQETSLMPQIAMGALAILSLTIGLGSGYFAGTIERIACDLDLFAGAPSVISSGLKGCSVAGFSAVSAPIFCVIALGAFLVVVIAARYLIRRNQKVRIGATWSCGASLSSRMEITATGFSRSIIVIFKRLLHPTIQHETEYHDVESRYLPKSRMVTLGIKDIHLSYLYRPMNKIITEFSEKAKSIQGGNINVYIFYIFMALLAALFLVK
jgi:hydrogenase-4 component B